MPQNTLQNIRDKVRRITRSPSDAQITTAQIDDYINTFLLYDLPSELRLFSLRTLLNFYTQPGVDVYETNTTDPLDPLFNFKNKYIAIHPQVFIAGVPATFTQWRDVFYGRWPQTNAIVDTGNLGNGGVGPFTGVVNTSVTVISPGSPTQPRILQRSVIFTALTAGAEAMILVDYPVAGSNILGYLGLPGQPALAPVPYGQINYLTGQYTVTFPFNTSLSTPQLPNPITVEYVPYVAGKPIDMLYYDNKFTIRPVPDRAYQIQLEADIRPTELLLNNQRPDIDQWWQYIAIGASKKIFEDRMDLEDVALLMPMLREQMNFVNRTNLEQNTNSRSQTIYTVGRANTWGWLGSNWPY